MGNPFELQACLRMDKKDIPNPLEIGKKYNFSKNGHRLYQIKVPMDLRDENWNAYGRCVITKYTLGEGKTIGTYVVVKIFDEIQCEQVTRAFVSDEEVDAVLIDIK
ncbi:MAG: hypothetical protein UR69_C0002G0236 [Candidatus Moranbacteria bacterium GW2011_GWE2_35_2-]|nr:MAG: hypothetical protein UR69_C0002G0236 [Candidatus Moranbacteria bacterium GW2011_GWE2_35_2-]KKQ22416.1 MAG: hypothetical protein US37_C0002G0041 [Candidatus Moranbacteria bacterium GW2011_GWF2_37_11]KKQ29485.1 MAG: hypothetical protein US44_C0001G0077 [Candidatus Moranbacteria bacterium GW2011_GWD1_37_17]KKQ30646.1 MAG: hypothetical protein US47_C0002G0236 [Candidatus Moranbacteria bacterium GW2011_GWE1_37_24]KKQ47748.1 MAG: hypothetical protein US66_C0006G0007 [Candidatus Moranbacteria 